MMNYNSKMSQKSNNRNLCVNSKLVKIVFKRIEEDVEKEFSKNYGHISRDDVNDN